MFELSINDRWCKGCALCADMCPKKVFDFGSIGNPPTAARPYDCVGCGRCVSICPDFAVTLKKKEEV